MIHKSGNLSVSEKSLEIEAYGKSGNQSQSEKSLEMEEEKSEVTPPEEKSNKNE